MIKEDEVEISINQRNVSYYRNLGYEISKNIFVRICDLNKSSKVRVTAICEICKSENEISYSKYYTNKIKKDYYSCFGCKVHVKEKTCIEKYGYRSYSMTDEFRKNESEKWKGIQKGSEKGRKTNLERYGVESFFKTDYMREMNRRWMSSNEFKEKSKNTIMYRFGVDHYSKTSEFKKSLQEKMPETIEKIKSVFLEKYGNEYLSKTEYWKRLFKESAPSMIIKVKKTCIDRYGVDNVSKVSNIQDKIRKTKLENGSIFSDMYEDEWKKYRKLVRKITKRNQRHLYEIWDGYDYYDNEFIKGYFSMSHTHRFYPTIDHKISIYYGFANSIDPEKIGSIDNLCITKRCINSTKSKMIEEEFCLNL